jgi:flagellar basal body-associated protein FliL
MHFSKNQIVTGLIIVLVIVSAVVWYFAFFSIKTSPKTAVSEKTSNPKLQQKEPAKGESKFASLKGDAFDEAYLADMLAYHQGKVN